MIDHVTQLSRVTASELTMEVLRRHPELDDVITKLQADNIYILRLGSLEAYTNTKHGDLADVVQFCESKLVPWLDSGENCVGEIRSILEQAAKV